MISVTFHDGLVALCDADLLGKHFEDEKYSLDVTERFYKGQMMNTKEVLEILSEATSINLVGKRVVELALREGFISEEDILYVQGVPHVQIYKV